MVRISSSFVSVGVSALQWSVGACGNGACGNDYTFNNNSLPIDMKLKLLFKLFEELGFLQSGATNSSTSTLPRFRVIQVRWIPPQPSVVKVNVDGASKGNSSLAAAGCVIREHYGRWLMGSARNLGCCTSIQAEIWAALLGLDTAWENGYRKIILETDSLLVYRFLTRSGPTQMLHGYWSASDWSCYIDAGRLQSLESLGKPISSLTASLLGP